ncbi:heme peroxidase [Obelidium mucronatum]|nr:heme peroxidase [Obelidium mucronatum]
MLVIWIHLLTFAITWAQPQYSNLSQIWNITEIQSMDGTGNNVGHRSWGSAGTPYLRLTPWEYGTNQTPNGQHLPNPRLISNVLFAQKPFLHNTDGISDFAPAWGVMLHLDITVASRNSSDPIPIPVPPNDPVFKIPGSPEDFIPVYRSDYIGVDLEKNLRIIPNAFTAFIDCSGLYGNSIEDMNHMRSFKGGKLKSVFLEKGEFPPVIQSGPLKGYFDFNIPNLNMMPQLMMPYLLFFREHNRRASELANRHPEWNDEQLFQRARRWVIAVVQKITVNNYVPAVTGEQLEPYQGYNPNINPGIDLFFANVAFRYGHSAINQFITRIDESGSQVPEGHIIFHKAFYEKLAEQVLKYGMESILRGLATQKDQVIDTHFVSEVRNYLPLNPGHYFDLAAIGIQRARELGIPSYSKIRDHFNLTHPYYWSDITADIEVQKALNELYGSVDDLDAYVGAFAEDKIDTHSIVSPIQRVSIRDQFTRLRDGDRFWYENPGVLSEFEMMELSTFTLGSMVRYNTNCTYYPNDPFVATPLASGFFLKGPSNVQGQSVSNTIKLMGKLLLTWNIRPNDGYIDFRFESNSTVFKIHGGIVFSFV